MNAYFKTRYGFPIEFYNDSSKDVKVMNEKKCLEDSDISKMKKL